jgi:hypothetical protein
MDAVEGGTDVAGRQEFRRVGLGLAAAAEGFAKIAGHEFAVYFRSATLAKEAEAVFGHGEMADLPGQVGRTAGRQAVPVGIVDIGQKSQTVVAGELDLLNGKGQRHKTGYTVSPQARNGLFGTNRCIEGGFLRFFCGEVGGFLVEHLPNLGTRFTLARLQPPPGFSRSRGCGKSRESSDFPPRLLLRIVP